MLNEILEFKAYVTNPKSDTPRIQPYLFTNSFSDSCELNGIEQILTVIARGFLFSDDTIKVYPIEALIDEQLIEMTIEILQRWCGFDDDKERKDSESNAVQKWFEEYPDADGWLKNYWQYHFDKGEKKKNSKLTREKLWEKVVKKWCVSLNEKKDYRAKRITYKNVIANALEMGPLRERYLAFKKDNTDKRLGKEISLNYLYQVKKDKPTPQKATKQKFLKNIATYLILHEYHPKNEKEVLLRRGQLLGWYGQDDAKGDTRIWFLSWFLWNDIPVFSRSDRHLHYIKFTVSPDYLEKFDFRLVVQDELKNYEDNYWILQDLGHGKETLSCINK